MSSKVLRSIIWIPRRSGGFTLIELLIVIAVIGILATIVLVSMSNVSSQARDARRISDIKQLMSVLEEYHVKTGHYPRSASCGGTTKPNPSWCNTLESFSGGRWIRDNGTTNVLAPFTASEPIDPLNKDYICSGPCPWPPPVGGYYYYSAGQSYVFVFRLEDTSNPIDKVDGATLCPNSPYDPGGSNSDGVITLGMSC